MLSNDSPKQTSSNKTQTLVSGLLASHQHISGLTMPTESSKGTSPLDHLRHTPQNPPLFVAVEDEVVDGTNCALAADGTGMLANAVDTAGKMPPAPPTSPPAVP